ncbi:MAG: winged helix-turn-helix transcriptional regulator [Bacteroidetes bacterium]|nr:winged helix-turn-helix transcriptional regulator [Bacteroidota bacterium]
MLAQDPVKQEMVHSFGDAYKAFGLNRLMGNVVGLLIASNEPLSLDEITETLGMSKGPISQITRRLSERGLIRKAWKPGSRKDYWEASGDIFGAAFRNHYAMIRSNTRLSRHLLELAEENPGSKVNHDRLLEMERFYMLMEKHFKAFTEEWADVRTKS